MGGGAAVAAGLWLSLALGCSHGEEAPRGPRWIAESPYQTPLPEPPLVPAPPFPPQPPVPVPCDVACGPSFTLALPGTLRWPAGTYYFRIAKDANPAQVCSVVFEPVFGASQDNCSSMSADFSVNYRYDSEVQRIESVDFQGALQHLRVEVLRSENAPHVFDFEDDLALERTQSCAHCLGYRASGSGLPETDAGTTPDAGHAGDAGDAGRETDAATGSP